MRARGAFSLIGLFCSGALECKCAAGYPATRIFIVVFHKLKALRCPEVRSGMDLTRLSPIYICGISRPYVLLCARVLLPRFACFPTYEAYIENFIAAVRLHCSHLTSTRVCATAPLSTTGTAPAGPAPPAAPAPHATPAALLAPPTRHARAASAASIASAAARDAVSLPLVSLPFAPAAAARAATSTRAAAAGAPRGRGAMVR